jgi:hypothetical protein
MAEIGKLIFFATSPLYPKMFVANISPPKISAFQFLPFIATLIII